MHFATYGVSDSQIIRKRFEEHFGWGKGVAYSNLLKIVSVVMMRAVSTSC
jgi:hypothetical protein